MSLKISILSKFATAPTYATDGAAGMDLYAAEDVVIPAKGQSLVDTGIAVAIMPGKCGQIWPRSGLDVKAGITRAAGLIDSDYRGPLKVLLVNRSDIDYPVSIGDRVAQMVVVPVFQETLEVVEKLPPTGRGSGGFGSTGV